MPVQQLPDEFTKNALGSPTNSSLSSTSSDVILISPNYVRNSRSASVSSSSTNIHDDDSIESSVNANNIRNRNLHSNEDIEEESYQPIKLPSEPTLEELLRQVTGKSDISMVDQVKLRIISSTISLQRLPYFMPRLRCLNLEGSMLFSLRDLGCDLSSLTYLNISRCSLKSLDGTNGLSTLTELVADHNLIEDAGPCSNIPQIRKISLVSNKIKDFSGMMFLGLCAQLRVLDLTNNAITQKENYRETVKGHIPQLAILDMTQYGDISDDVKNDLSRSEFQTSVNNSTSNIMRRLDSIQNNLQVVRPSTASSEPPITHISIAKRPTTGTEKNKSQLKNRNLSVGEPVCGNIIAKVRQPRKLRTAWGDSASSSSSFSSDSSNYATPRNSASVRSNGDSCETLLESARLWREKSRATREKFNDR